MGKDFQDQIVLNLREYLHVLSNLMVITKYVNLPYVFVNFQCILLQGTKLDRMGTKLYMHVVQLELQCFNFYFYLCVHLSYHFMNVDDWLLLSYFEEFLCFLFTYFDMTQVYHMITVVKYFTWFNI